MSYRPFFIYGDNATPPDDEDDQQASAEYRAEEREREEAEQEFDRGAIECDERAPWPEPTDAEAATSRDAAGMK